MLWLLAVNGALIVLLAMTNQDRVLDLSWWLYSAASSWVTTSTVLIIYGLVLIYLLLVVHSRAGGGSHSPRNRRNNRLVPYYDHDGMSLSMHSVSVLSVCSRETPRLGEGRAGGNKLRELWCVF